MLRLPRVKRSLKTLDLPSVGSAESWASCRDPCHLTVDARRAEDSGLVNRTAAANIQPGQYKADRDFVTDKTSEVCKDVDARFRKAPRMLGLVDHFCLQTCLGPACVSLIAVLAGQCAASNRVNAQRAHEAEHVGNKRVVSMCQIGNNACQRLKQASHDQKKGSSPRSGISLKCTD